MITRTELNRKDKRLQFQLYRFCSCFVLFLLLLPVGKHSLAERGDEGLIALWVHKKAEAVASVRKGVELCHIRIGSVDRQKRGLLLAAALAKKPPVNGRRCMSSRLTLRMMANGVV